MTDFHFTSGLTQHLGQRAEDSLSLLPRYTFNFQLTPIQPRAPKDCFKKNNRKFLSNSDQPPDSTPSI